MTSTPAPSSFLELQTALGISFRDKTWLRRALTHRSYLNENPEPRELDNERLEFLGDAILDWVTAEFLYQRFPTMSEGDLTQVRAAVVRTETLARFAQRLGLAPHIRMARGEEAQGGRTRRPILADAFEAVIAAIYLDQGLSAARRVALQFIAPEIDRMRQEGERRDAKSVLQEWLQATERIQPRYRVVAVTGPQHAQTFVVAVSVKDRELARGQGSNKRRAEESAAAAALAQIPLASVA